MSGLTCEVKECIRPNQLFTLPGCDDVYLDWFETFRCEKFRQLFVCGFWIEIAAPNSQVPHISIKILRPLFYRFPHPISTSQQAKLCVR
jgi:hypothetical protein